MPSRITSGILPQTGANGATEHGLDQKRDHILAMPVARKMMATEIAWAATMVFHAGRSKLLSPKLAVVVARLQF